MKKWGACVSLAILAGAGLSLLLLASCSGGHGPVLGQPPVTGTVTTNLSDPPTCAAPNGPFQKVWVTITRVRAHISADADPSGSGWVDLVDLRKSPAQIDMLSLASASCLLNQIGSATGLPPGNYQQIRVILLSNTPASGEATPASNKCGSGNGFNCVVPTGGSPQMLQLTIEADTGIKIPPGQIAGGGLNLTAAQSADLDIDFDACRSVVGQGNGGFHLKPTLHAGQVSVSSNSLHGRVVDNAKPANPIPNAIVLLEQPDAGGVDRVIFSEVGAADGTFIFCPLPAGNYDVVVAGQTTSAAMVTTTYNATILLDVPLGTAVGDIPLLPESGSPGASTLPVKITGLVTTSTAGNTATSADASLLALQQATPTGGSTLAVTIPIFGASSQPPTAPTSSGAGCGVGTDCATYTLLVPGSNPQVGTFSASGTSFAVPTSGNALYTVEADSPACTPPSQTSSQLSLMPGGVAGTANFIFTGCP
jgi:hypothetical protein